MDELLVVTGSFPHQQVKDLKKLDMAISKLFYQRLFCLELHRLMKRHNEIK